jgi:hypothetical protein
VPFRFFPALERILQRERHGARIGRALAVAGYDE